MIKKTAKEDCVTLWYILSQFEVKYYVMRGISLIWLDRRLQLVIFFNI
jgi:hypothetical protein